MTVATPVSSDLDLFADEVLLDPYPYFAELREQAPVVHLEKAGIWALTRHSTIREALGNWAVFSSRSVAFNDQMNQALAGTSLATDPPDHQRLRSVLSERLMPRAVRGLQEDIDAKADAMVAELVERGSFDAVTDLASALPLAVVADLIGVQGEVRDNMLRWGAAAQNVLGPMNPRTVENFPVAGQLFQWAHNAQAEELAEGSMGRAIFDAAERGEIPPESAGMIIHQYVAAGLDTTIAGIGNAIAQLAANPDQFDLLRADRSLLASTFAEALRYEAPIHAMGRLVTEDVEIEGTLVPAGAQVAVLFGSGNRDSRRYEDPDTFLARRNPLDHLSFGYGVHGCAGQALARLEAHAVLDALARRVRRFTIGQPERRPHNEIRSLYALPVVEVDPA
ncbi:cytochrome P450 [Geodermatophilus sabuli]|uniref:Cytochrome P450 n=1 Tax=Geodermatophilus sabuli TaxID=1564158 RepID=A0A285EBN2_9ACTN|nr:cytochrome P450 [Geodermatophilus sabuli]MBB3084344.1 cytochrome P450 [Geodermatophilus sabuli]SNX96387.1 Cytochrome P450 [Geodermatophilus sabuli]